MFKHIGRLKKLHILWEWMNILSRYSGQKQQQQQKPAESLWKWDIRLSHSSSFLGENNFDNIMNYQSNNR